MKKYLINGQEVCLIREVEGGFLYSPIYISYDNESDYVDDSVIYFADKLYDTPPKEKIHQDIIDLTIQKEVLNKDISDIQRLKNQEKSLLGKVKQIDFIQCLLDYINGDFNFVLRMDTMEIKGKDSVYISPYIKITNTKKRGWSLYVLRSENYEDYDDRAIRVFKTFDVAQSYAKSVLINNLKWNTEKSNYPWRSDVIKDWYNKINYTSKLKDDEDLKKVYLQKFGEAKLKEDKDKKEKLQKEIEEKQKMLEKI